MLKKYAAMLLILIAFGIQFAHSIIPHHNHFDGAAHATEHLEHYHGHDHHEHHHHGHHPESDSGEDLSDIFSHYLHVNASFTFQGGEDQAHVPATLMTICQYIVVAADTTDVRLHYHPNDDRLIASPSARSIGLRAPPVFFS